MAKHHHAGKAHGTDVVIVGSGAGGSMAAYMLTRAGLNCVLLEAGRDYDPSREVNMLATSAMAPLRDSATADKPFGFFDATVDGGWQVPGEPYTVADGSTFKWWRTRMLGGRTNHWARHVPRFGPYDFKGFSRDGLGVDWPISYDDVAPWYDRTERLVGVYGVNSGLENHPSSSPGVLHAPPKPRIHELLIQAAAADLGIPVIPTRTAILTRDMPDPHAPRSACYYASPCGRGCNIGAAFQTTTSLLPMARATGRLKTLTGAMVTRVRLSKPGRAAGVTYIDKATGQTHDVDARAVVLAASACETARLLLNSGEDGQAGLANGSGQVGRNLMDTIGAHVGAYVPALEGRPIYNEEGANMPHMYVPFWLYKEQAAGRLNFRRGYHFEIGGGFGPPSAWTGPDDLPDGYGAGMKAGIKRKMGCNLHMTVRGEMIPNAQSFCERDPTIRDRYGIPVLRFHWQWQANDYAMVEHGLATATAVLTRAGGRITSPAQSGKDAISTGGEIIHEVGTARMGDDARTSVVDRYSQAWEVDNLILADGSVMASQPHKNPTLTIMALAMRASDRLAQRLKTGALA